MGIIYGSDAIIRVCFKGLIISAFDTAMGGREVSRPYVMDRSIAVCVGGLVLFSGLHLFGYVLGPGVDVVGEFGGVGQFYFHVGAYA